MAVNSNLNTLENEHSCADKAAQWLMHMFHCHRKYDDKIRVTLHIIIILYYINNPIKPYGQLSSHHFISHFSQECVFCTVLFDFSIFPPHDSSSDTCIFFCDSSPGASVFSPNYSSWLLYFPSTPALVWDFFINTTFYKIFRLQLLHFFFFIPRLHLWLLYFPVIQHKWYLPMTLTLKPSQNCFQDKTLVSILLLVASFLDSISGNDILNKKKEWLLQHRGRMASSFVTGKYKRTVWIISLKQKKSIDKVLLYHRGT